MGFLESYILTQIFKKNPYMVGIEGFYPKKKAENEKY